MSQITTVFDSQTELLRAIMDLHNGGEPFQADVTYGNGEFYRDLPEPQYKFDINPKDSTVTKLDVRYVTPVGSYASIVFDPPFIHAPGKDSIMGQRFGGYPSQKLLREFYDEALERIHTVLRPKGLLVMKCQDIVESGKQNMNHCHIWVMAMTLGFKVEDLLILVRKSAPTGHNHHVQRHARKVHSYFWVFRKGKG